jgi:RNA polymerase sigma-70 factor, ECF subfamily
MGEADLQFQSSRPILLGLSYRLLGSLWDAEDIVQDAYLRWMGSEHTGIRKPEAFLITIVTRLCIDHLQSARVKRETYPGPWLPEPVMTAALGPMETAELRDTVSYATLHMMERLTPPERAVFVLREAFGLPYGDIAPIVGATAAACRQLRRRAGERLARDGHRPSPGTGNHAELLTQFLAAARGGDLTALAQLLTKDVTAWNDGGGRVRAALRPISGRDKVIAFVMGLAGRYSIQGGRILEVNGEMALWIEVDGGSQLVTAGTRDGRIHAIYAILNPDKLKHVTLPP